MTTPPRVRVYGRNSRDLAPLLERYGLQEDEENPEVIVTYGGDGTLLGAEREWPGVPKVALRDSRRCRTCSHHSNEEILEHLARGTLKTVRFPKLLARADGHELICLNDIIIRNAKINVGVRLLVKIDGDYYTDRDIVGDGLVISTPFGSSAYFASITHCTFHTGIGLAFNNNTERINHVIVREDSLLEVRLTRGPGLMSADNDPTHLALDKDDVVTVRRAGQEATILIFDRVQYTDRQVFY
jgi:NAD+ kinase